MLFINLDTKDTARAKEPDEQHPSDVAASVHFSLDFLAQHYFLPSLPTDIWLLSFITMHQLTDSAPDDGILQDF